MQGLTNDVERSNTRRSGPKDRVLPSSLDRKLLEPRARFEQRKGLPGSGNPVNVEKELAGEWSTRSKLLGILIHHRIVKLPLFSIERIRGCIHHNELRNGVFGLDLVPNIRGYIVTANVQGPILVTVHFAVT